MNPDETDDIAKLAYGLTVQFQLPGQAGIEAVAGMYGVTQERASELIARGRYLAKLAGDLAA